MRIGSEIFHLRPDHFKFGYLLLGRRLVDIEESGEGELLGWHPDVGIGNLGQPGTNIVPINVVSYYFTITSTQKYWPYSQSRIHLDQNISPTSGCQLRI